MRRPLMVGVVFIVLVLGALELFYFRFHSYFQSVEIQETLPPVAADAPGAMQPRTIVAGSFVTIDFFHKGTGTARIVEQEGERYVLFDDLDVTNGPDLYVYLIESEMPISKLDSLGTFTDLGRLKGNKGNQMYDIPAGTPQAFRTVVIWCKQFGVLFSFAVMR